MMDFFRKLFRQSHRILRCQRGRFNTLALVFFLAFSATSSWAWNALGHRVIAQIAYDQLTPKAKRLFNYYNHALDVVYKPQSFVNAATWLDTLRYKDIAWFDSMHYIDLPINADEKNFAVQRVNALWAIEKANKLIQNPYATAFDKGLAFRILIHVVGDIHQPLHTATRTTGDMPEGDKGGNLVVIHDATAKNLHAYWDRGAGFLYSKQAVKPTQIKIIAHQLESNYPCVNFSSGTAADWVKESHQLAMTVVYKPLGDNHTITEQYQLNAQKTVSMQLAKSGCRLGGLLNALANPT